MPILRTAHHCSMPGCCGVPITPREESGAGGTAAITHLSIGPFNTDGPRSVMSMLKHRDIIQESSSVWNVIWLALSYHEPAAVRTSSQMLGPHDQLDLSRESVSQETYRECRSWFEANDERVRFPHASISKYLRNVGHHFQETAKQRRIILQRPAHACGLRYPDEGNHQPCGT